MKVEAWHHREDLAEVAHFEISVERGLNHMRELLDRGSPCFMTHAVKADVELKLLKELH